MSLPKLAPGLVLEENWYAVEQIDSRTFAIGEPSYYQQNWSYLIVGDEEALMFDTGSFSRDITPVISARVEVPVMALPSHMHFDHLGNVHRFEHVKLADLPMLRACESAGRVTPSEFLFLGAYEDRTAPTFPVSEWLALESTIELGGRKVQIVHTPGHSPDSVSLFEADAGRLYAADFIYNGDLYGQTPGADLADYLSVAESLLDRMAEDVSIFCAHGNVADSGVHQAPRMGREALVHLVSGLRTVRDTCAGWDQAPEWCAEIDEHMRLLISPEAIAAWRAAD